jgi:hypothetical protein
MLYTLIKVLHIFAVMAVVAGVVGRALIRARVIRIDEITVLQNLPC